ncbi:MAG: ABC transporter permease [Saprospiraceae bacterium]
MLKNYFKIAIRSLFKDKVIAAINILSLAIGFAGVIAIFFYVSNEMSIDRFHINGNRVFRLTYDETIKVADGRHLATTSPPMGPALVANYPQVEKAIRLRYTQDVVLSYKDQQNYEQNLVYADPAFFELFSFPLQKGNPTQALAAPNTIVLTPALAARYFGSEDPIGKSLVLDGETSLTVTGVLKEAPLRSHLDFDGLISFSTFKVPFGYPVNLQSWGWISFHTYLLLKDAASAPVVEAQLDQFLADNMSAQRAERATLHLQPLKDVYFHSGTMLNSNAHKNGSLVYTYGLSVLALLLLLVAGFNYMNISTARSIKRAKETGIRKVMGALRKTLFVQFVGEAMVVALCSLGLGLLLVEIFKGYIFTVLNLENQVTLGDYLFLLPLFIGMALLAGFLAGLYPASVLSRFRIIDVLKGQVKTGQGGLNIRKALIIAQFVVTAALISSSLVVTQQMQFIRNKALGFESEQLVSLTLQRSDFLERYPLAHQIFTQNPNVLQVSAGDIFDDNYGSVPIIPEGVNAEDAPAMNLMGGYFDYLSTLGVNFVEGRDFSSQHPGDTANSVIINEAAAKVFGWDNPLGKKLQISNIKEAEVIGVIEDFNYKSLHDPIGPLVLVVPETRMKHFILRIKTDNLQQTIASLQEDWAKFASDSPFEFAFIDEQMNKVYQADNRFSGLINFFSMLTILLACLGLYGLMATMVQFRSREIGVRKVLGATVVQITTLLSRQFVLLLVLANGLAIPIAFIAMRSWLSNFAYHIDLNWTFFLLASVLTILLALFSILHQSLKAAWGDPVKSLREE